MRAGGCETTIEPTIENQVLLHVLVWTGSAFI